MTRQTAIDLAAPTKLDLAIARYFPKWATARLRARREFSYEAARSSRLRNSAVTLAGPEDFMAFPDRIALIKQVRDLEQNFGLFQSIIDKLGLYAFGRLRYQARTGNPAIDQQYEDYLRECFDTADLSGRHDFQQLAAIAFKSELRDGDFGLKWRRDAGQLKLQGIESDRIGGNIAINIAENKFQGITIDLDTGRPLIYDVYQRTKAGSYRDKVDVRAADMLFLFDPRRIDQYRGITPFAPIVNEARDLKEVLEACLQGTKFENYHAAIGYTPSGQPLADPSALITSTETDANGVAIKEQQLKPGMIQWAPSDSEYDFMKSDRPSGTFQTYVEMLVSLQGIALNLPTSFIWKMLGTGPAVRADLQQAHRVVEWHQENVSRRILTPVVKTWLIDGFASGRIPYTVDWWCGRWQFAPAVSIDAGRESNARVQERNAGLRSSDSVFVEDGEDADEQRAIIKNETRQILKDAQELAKELDVDLPVVLTMLGGRTPNGFLFSTPEQEEPEAEPEAKKPAAATEMSSLPGDVPKREQVRTLILAAKNRHARLLESSQRRNGSHRH